ncbi:MAG: polysaccharide deacetylase family protein [Tuberibacillus sp.]
MRFIWVLNGRKIKNITLIVLAAFFAALVAFVQNEEVAVFKTSEGPRALSKVNTDKKEIALTFDIGWGDTRIKQIMSILKSRNIAATFFVTGEWAGVHPDLIEEMKNARFEIGSHGMKHNPYTAMDAGEIRRDISLANTSIKKAGVDGIKYLRPPEGQINTDIINTVSRSNMQVVLWSVYPHDDQNPGYKTIVNNVVKQTKKGAIIRLHASDSVRDTVRALPEMIQKLNNAGYTFVTLSDLVSNADAKNKLVE